MNKKQYEDFRVKVDRQLSLQFMDLDPNYNPTMNPKTLTFSGSEGQHDIIIYSKFEGKKQYRIIIYKDNNFLNEFIFKVDYYENISRIIDLLTAVLIKYKVSI